MPKQALEMPWGPFFGGWRPDSLCPVPEFPPVLPRGSGAHPCDCSCWLREVPSIGAWLWPSTGCRGGRLIPSISLWMLWSYWGSSRVHMASLRSLSSWILNSVPLTLYFSKPRLTALSHCRTMFHVTAQLVHVHAKKLLPFPHMMLNRHTR